MTRSDRQFRHLASSVPLLCCLLSGLTARAETPSSDLTVQVAGGLGVGGRSMQTPTRVGIQQLPMGVFPAGEVGLRVSAWPTRPASLAFVLGYQTALYDTVHEPAPGAPSTEIRLRSHHLELGVAPTVRLGDTVSACAVALQVGYSMRVLWPDVHNQLTPRQVLTGPHLRPELVVPIGSAVQLRVGPELFWILTMNNALQQKGVGPRGLALGGQASLQVALGDGYALALRYRESHAFASSVFVDVERFLTLSLAKEF